MRLFVAVNVPAFEVPGLDLRPGNGPPHFTLKFLGEVEEPRVTEVMRALAACLAGARGGPATMEGMGAFPSIQRPRILWVGVGQGQDLLTDLSRRVEDAMTGLGFPREDRPFQAHVTLVRIKDRAGGEAARAAIERNAHHRFAQFEIREVLLRKSVLVRGGAEHTTLAAYPLGEALA